MKNRCIGLFVFFTMTTFAQFGQGMQQGMRGGNNQMNQISQPRMEEKKPEPLTNEEVLKKMTLIAGLDELQQLQVRELLVKMPKPVEPKNQAEFEEQRQLSEKLGEKLKKILSAEQIEKWIKGKNKEMPKEKVESRKERKERERKQQEYLDGLK